ncbi:LysR substrate-binding domain-containing protein [Paracoccus sp. TOH]|uniref:LysR substrate-binding domain-containing protein n=1 Tax=Paracoccus sp. TOH TaxID=1263728 RepID=UPI0025AED677|nr:LysR substrate-binding domain-containing protein [Paracoccus sp. TOH]WJS86900.1 LysR substrate-binding domain-containing protein [Paracoccus sp. TOH]
MMTAETQINQISARDRFVTGMSHAACTVNVVTTDGRAGRAGVTVSAMASVSADGEAPTLLVCVHHLSPAAPKIIENGVLCVNVLREDQSYISEAFAGRFKDELGDKFECTDWVALPSGPPRVADALVAFECRVVSAERVGTHYVLLCGVEDTHSARLGSPLIYANRSYGSSRRIDAPRSMRGVLNGKGIALNVGCFHTFGPFLMPALIRQLGGLDIGLLEGDQRRLTESLISGETELALIYDIGLDDRFECEALATLTPYVLLAADHPLARQSEILPIDLAAEPMVLLDAPPSGDYFTGILQAQGVEPVIAHRSVSFEMVRGMVAHGLGYTLLVTKPTASMSYDGLPLVARPLAGDCAPSHLVLAWRRGHRLGSAAERFARKCREQFARA